MNLSRTAPRGHGSATSLGLMMQHQNISDTSCFQIDGHDALTVGFFHHQQEKETPHMSRVNTMQVLANPTGETLCIKVSTIRSYCDDTKVARFLDELCDLLS